MKKISRIFIGIGFLIMAAFPGTGFAESEKLIIDIRSTAASDVVFRPAFPIQNQPCEVAVTVHNTGKTAADRVQVNVQGPDGVKIGTKTIAIPAEGKAQAVFPWTPARNGYIPLKISASDGESSNAVAVKAPVVSRTFYFPWFGGHTPEARSLRYANVVLSGNAESHAYWRNRGAIPCLWKGVDNKVAPEKYAQILADGVGDPARDAAGIMIDEMGGYAPEEILAANFFSGLKLYLEKNPQYFTALWICGSLQVPYCNITRNAYRKDKGISLLMLECYTNFQTVEFSSSRRFAYFDQRIDVARQQDVLTNAVMTLAIDGHKDKFNLTGYELEDEVRYIRRNAPEMPGIGFFHFETKSPELIPIADDLCRRYFIEPVLQLYPEDIQFSSRQVKAGDEIEIYAGVRNLGGMDAENVKIRLYADGKLLKEDTRNIPALAEGAAPRAVQLQANWKAPASGYHTFRVEVIPSGSETVLDGTGEQQLWVR